MKPPRRPRLLSGEESWLWGEIAKLVTPLRGRARPKPGPASAQSLSQTSEPKRPGTKTAKPQPVEPAAKASKPPRHRAIKLGELAPATTATPSRPVKVTTAPKPPGLERRERMGLRRGSLTIDARIDLHGLYQADAHAALVGFVLRARDAGHARILVVTGKGGDKGCGDAYSERGVLRRSVPHWLRGAELGHIVLGFEEAARHHGGAGALYVRLRRR